MRKFKFFATILFLTFLYTNAAHSQEKEGNMPHASVENTIRHKKNIVFMYPFQLIQLAPSIGYERILGDNKFGVGANFIYASKEKLKDANVELRYYFWETRMLDMDYDHIHLHHLYFETFVGASGNYVAKPGYLNYATRAVAGTRLQFVTGLNVSIYGMVGPGFIVDELHETGETNFTSWSVRFAAGWRF